MTWDEQRNVKLQSKDKRKLREEKVTASGDAKGSGVLALQSTAPPGTIS